MSFPAKALAKKAALSIIVQIFLNDAQGRSQPKL